MAEQQVPVVQARQKGGIGKTIISIILIIVLITLGFYGYSWATSDVGRQWRVEKWELAVGSLQWYPERLKEAGEIGRIWETEPSETAGKVGVKFQAFEIMGNKIVPSGSSLAFRYKFDVGEGVHGVPLKLECTIKDKNKEKIEELQPIIRPTERPEIYTDDPSSYSKSLCQINTKEENEDKIITVEGKVSFPYERQRNSLKVYFTSDTINKGAKFFEKIGLEEKLPIKAKYNNEPVELGLGVGGDNIQPVIIGENQFPAIGISLKNKWDGKVTKIKDMNLYLPEEVIIDKKTSPPNTFCPFGEPTKSGTGYIRYKAEKKYLDQIQPFGKGIGEGVISTYQPFLCWLKIDESILLGVTDYVPDQYSVDVSYDYEFQPKSETITLKAIQKGEEIEEITEPEPTPETKYYLCQDKTTGGYKCVTTCTPNCEDWCTTAVYDLLEDCTGDLPR